jgi:hypothetical protein
MEQGIMEVENFKKLRVRIMQPNRSYFRAYYPLSLAAYTTLLN